MAWIIPVATAAIGAMSSANQSSKAASGQRGLMEQLSAGFNDFQTQKFLPSSLRIGRRQGSELNAGLTSGLRSISELMKNPGQLNPNIAGAIAARLSQESEQIARGTQGALSESSGALARSGTGSTPFATALQSGIMTQGNQRQADARRQAVQDSEQLRRQDLAQVFDIYNLILQFINSGRGLQGQAVTGASNIIGQQSAGNQAGLAALVNAIGKVDWSNVHAGQQKGPG